MQAPRCRAGGSRRSCSATSKEHRPRPTPSRASAAALPARRRPHGGVEAASEIGGSSSTKTLDSRTGKLRPECPADARTVGDLHADVTIARIGGQPCRRFRSPQELTKELPSRELRRRGAPRLRRRRARGTAQEGLAGKARVASPCCGGHRRVPTGRCSSGGPRRRGSQC
jgi:hypothetical protein